ncbi:protein DCL, chloroplastic isoform X2 [Silene latifolia]|uniref:protein DCL, chloroplastic isoform X2 n=1 Tax=Silene latifolia TaxID=37657 RepID=UPI003D780E49
MAASSPLVRGLPLLRRHFRIIHHHHYSLAAVLASPRRPICSFASESEVVTEATQQLRPKNLSNLFTNIDDSEYRKWKDREDEIFRDIQPTSLFAKEILHSDRYMDGERLTVDDEKFVLEKLLAYHPHSADKIGCGLDSIMELGYIWRLLEVMNAGRETRGCSYNTVAL